MATLFAQRERKLDGSWQVCIRRRLTDLRSEHVRIVATYSPCDGMAALEHAKKIAAELREAAQ